MSDNEKPQVDPEEVKAFLSDEIKKDEKDDSKRVRIPLSEEDQAAVRRIMKDKPVEESTESKPKTKKTVPSDTVYDQEDHKQEQLLPALMRRMADLSGIDVTEEEKQLYLKSMLHDEPMFLDILVESVDMKFRFKSRTNYENDILYGALGLDQKEGLIVGVPEYASRAARYAVCISLDKIGEVHFKRADFKDCEVPVPERVEELRALYRREVVPMNSTRWGLIELAGRIFEHKLALCHQNVVNKDFWNPVSAN